MPMSPIRRRLLAFGIWGAAPALLGARLVRASARARPEAGTSRSALAALDRFIAGYCAAMNAPGLTLGLADAEGAIRTSAYGYVDLKARIPVTTQDLFEIGSITKSFVALTILQLREQGKVDLEAPIRSYLPWLSMQTDHGDILIHHLLTHSSGMPDDAPVFPPSPERRPRQAFAPGSEFHYSNWGYTVLGHLIETLDGRAWPTAVGARILRPLGMTSTSASIDNASRARLAQSYVPLHDDRPYPRHGPLAPAGILETEGAAGSIASTPGDMVLYMRMILNGGAYPGGRIVSEESFKLFSTGHIPAPDFGPTASYGYGIAVDELDGHRRLRHTGGMVSFMSAMHLDLDSGLGAFASINAQLDYRPNPVAQLALRLLRSSKEGKALPDIPPFDESANVEAPQSYEGVYIAQDGRRMEVSSAAGRVFLAMGGAKLALQHLEGDSFLAEHAGLDLYPLLFERAAGEGSNADAKRPVIALAYGPDWYAHANHPAPTLEPSPDLARYAGAYYSDNPWNGWVRVVQRQRRIWLNGTDAMTPIGDHLFRVGEKPTSPETAEFSDWVGGFPRTLRFDGGEFGRIEVEEA
jgi:CubicO group peptidase (beta-lactamase class C family)